MSVLSQLFFRNWRLKLAAFALAIFLWAVVTIQPRNRQTLTSVPVQVTITDPAWTLAEPPAPALVDVRLGGSTRELLQLGRTPGAGVVRVPIERVTSQDTVVRLRNDWFEADAGSGIVVENIVPATVHLVFEATEATVLPLSVRTRNEFPEGLALAQPLGLTPPVVRVRGPVRVVDDLDSIPLEPLDLAAVGESGIYQVRVDTAGLGNLTMDPAVASLQVLLERAVERVIGGVPVVGELPPTLESATLEILPATIQVTLRGARTPVNQANVEVIEAIVPSAEIEGLAPGEERTVPIRLRGVPNLVRAFSAADSVLIRRPAEGRSPPDTARRDTASVATPGRRAPDAPRGAP